MKVIDLLNKIANGEEVPKKVKITTGTLKDEYRIWVWEGCWYVYELDGKDVFICTDELELNDEVEILEEKKIPEKLNKNHFHKRQRQLANKINEIIDYLKNKGEE
jgi:hypothetical protein